MLRDPTYTHEPHLHADTVLANCLDFRHERTELQDIVESRGHILLISVKCHPECAGAGIEYCWGKLKIEFRKRNCQKEKRKSGKELIKAILQLINDPNVLPITIIWRYARRTREYMRMYMSHYLNSSSSNNSSSNSTTSTNVDLTHKLLENMKKECKTHRNIMEIERDYLMNT